VDAHSKQIAHRDLKPTNVFMTREGGYKIGDFGSYFEKKGSLPAVTTVLHESQQRLTEI